MTAPFGFTVTLVRRGAETGKDSLGVPTYAPANTAVPGCLFAPGSSTESVQGQDQVVQQPTVYAPTGTNATAVDEVIVPGYGSYEVDGDPQAWPPHPMTGWQPANSVVIRLRRVTG